MSICSNSISGCSKCNRWSCYKCIMSWSNYRVSGCSCNRNTISCSNPSNTMICIRYSSNTSELNNLTNYRRNTTRYNNEIIVWPLLTNHTVIKVICICRIIGTTIDNIYGRNISCGSNNYFCSCSIPICIKTRWIVNCICFCRNFYIMISSGSKSWCSSERSSYNTGKTMIPIKNNCWRSWCWISNWRDIKSNT